MKEEKKEIEKIVEGEFHDLFFAATEGKNDLRREKIRQALLSYGNTILKEEREKIRKYMLVRGWNTNLEQMEDVLTPP